MYMEIRSVTYGEVENAFSQLKPDLLDICAKYYGCFIDDELIGVVSYVKEEHRNKGIYKMLWNYRDGEIKESDKQVYAHCNVDSLKYFINNGYSIEKALFKVVKNK